MKIALLCDSLLLEKSLQNYLKEYITSKEDTDFFICDKMIATGSPIFLIGYSSKVHLRVPFTRLELFEALEKFYDEVVGVEMLLSSKEQMKPFIERLNKKHHNKIAKLARKIL